MSFGPIADGALLLGRNYAGTEPGKGYSDGLVMWSSKLETGNWPGEGGLMMAGSGDGPPEVAFIFSGTLDNHWMVQSDPAKWTISGWHAHATGNLNQVLGTYNMREYESEARHITPYRVFSVISATVELKTWYPADASTYGSWARIIINRLEPTANYAGDAILSPSPYTSVVRNEIFDQILTGGASGTIHYLSAAVTLQPSMYEMRYYKGGTPTTPDHASGWADYNIRGMPMLDGSASPSMF